MPNRDRDDLTHESQLMAKVLEEGTVLPPRITAIRPTRTERRAFSLLEMVFATALLAGILVPALAVMRDAMAMSRATTSRSLIANYAVQKIEEQVSLGIGTWTNSTDANNYAADGHPEIAFNSTRSDDPSDGGITGSLMHVQVIVFEDLDSDLTPDTDELAIQMRTKVAKLATYENDEQ